MSKWDVFQYNDTNGIVSCPILAEFLPSCSDTEFHPTEQLHFRQLFIYEKV